MKVSLLFPGQGAQTVGMGNALHERSKVARETYARASEILGYDLVKLCAEGPAEKLNRTEYGQPALFVHSYAALKQLESERSDLWKTVVAVAGLSLGEYTAVAAAGGIDFGTGLKLVQLRGKAMQQAADAVASGMTSVIGLEIDKIEEICQAATQNGEFVSVANLLCPGNTAVSGHVGALERAEGLSMEAGALKAIRLQVAGAFHTSLMQPAVETLRNALTNVEFVETHVPVYSNVDALPHSNPDDFRDLLAQQVVKPVLWEDSLRSMVDLGTDEFLEVGTGRILAGTLKRIKRKLKCENFGD